MTLAIGIVPAGAKQGSLGSLVRRSNLLYQLGQALCMHGAGCARQSCPTRPLARPGLVAVCLTVTYRQVELDLVPAAVEAHWHCANERLHARRGLRAEGMPSGFSVRWEATAGKQSGGDVDCIWGVFHKAKKGTLGAGKGQGRPARGRVKCTCAPGSWTHGTVSAHSCHPALAPRSCMLEPLKTWSVWALLRGYAARATFCATCLKYLLRFLMIRTRKGSLMPRVLLGSAGQVMNVVDTFCPIISRTDDWMSWSVIRLMCPLLTVGSKRFQDAQNLPDWPQPVHT